MASLEELEARVAALESEVRAIKQDSAAARVLAGGADRDVAAFAGKLETHKALLEALRETQVEQGRELTAQHQELTAQRQELTELREEMRDGFGTLAVGQAEITTLLRRLTDDSE